MTATAAPRFARDFPPASRRLWSRRNLLLGGVPLADIQAYYRASDVGDHHNYYMGRAEADLTNWVEYFVQTLATVFEAAKQEALKHAGASIITEPEELRRLNHRAKTVLARFARQEQITSAEVPIALGLSERMARRCLSEWVQDGWLVISNPSRAVPICATGRPSAAVPVERAERGVMWAARWTGTGRVAELDRLVALAEKQLAQLDRGRERVAGQLAALREQRSRFRLASAILPRRALSVAGQRYRSRNAPALSGTGRRARTEVESAKTGRSGYSPACKNEWVQGVCQKPRVKCADCLEREFLPLSDEIVRQHVFGGEGGREVAVGIYPLLPDETCWFLAADFDKASWQEDALAFLQTCRSFRVSAALERSRSGKGGHVWIFFAEAIPGFPRPQARLLSSHPNHGAAARDRTRFLRPFLPKPGYHAPGRLREPHRPPAPTGATPTREQRLP